MCCASGWLLKNTFFFFKAGLISIYNWIMWRGHSERCSCCHRLVAIRGTSAVASPLSCGGQNKWQRSSIPLCHPVCEEPLLWILNFPVTTAHNGAKTVHILACCKGPCPALGPWITQHYRSCCKWSYHCLLPLSERHYAFCPASTLTFDTLGLNRDHPVSGPLQLITVGLVLHVILHSSAHIILGWVPTVNHSTREDFFFWLVCKYNPHFIFFFL